MMYGIISLSLYMYIYIYIYIFIFYFVKAVWLGAWLGEAPAAFGAALAGFGKCPGPR